MSALTALSDTAICRVGDIAEQIRGVSYSKGDVRTAPEPGYVPLLRGGNVQEYGLTFEDLQFVPAAIVSEKQLLQAGDIVVVASSGSLSGVGKAASVPAGFQGTFGAFCKVIRPKENVDAGYLGHYFRTADYRSRVSSLAGGANINNLKNEHLDKLEVRLPSLSEQRRLATILDQADDLRRKRRLAMAGLDSLARSIFDSMFGRNAPRTGWKAGELGQYVRFYGGSSLPEAMQFSGQEDGFALLKVSDMNLPGNETRLVHSNLWSERSGSKASTCPKDTVVIPKRGAAISTNKKRITTRPSVLDPNLMGISPGSDLTIEYLYAWFDAFNLESITSGSSVPQLNKQDLAPLAVDVPPLALQKAFAGQVTKIQQIQQYNRAQLAHLDTLFSSLQHRVFKGEL